MSRPPYNTISRHSALPLPYPFFESPALLNHAPWALGYCMKESFVVFSATAMHKRACWGVLYDSLEARGLVILDLID